GLLEQQSKSDQTTITNMNTKPVNVVYWDAAAWKPVEIAPGATVSLKGQADGLRVRFNDGAADQSVILDVGGRYAISGNEAARWVIRPYDEVARSSTGLRSR